MLFARRVLHAPGVAVVDLNMPGGSGLEAIQRKTSCSTRAELVRYALDHSLVET